MGRWIRFLIAIAVGAGGGMLYGWVLNPVEYVDTAPDSLRFDYRADYVLMVAEAYQVENSLGLASRRLALLGSDPPYDIASQALADATQIGYPSVDLSLMQTLVQDLQTWNPSQEIPLP
jgi:hypothetical protein